MESFKLGPHPNVNFDTTSGPIKAADLYGHINKPSSSKDIAAHFHQGTDYIYNILKTNIFENNTVITFH